VCSRRIKHGIGKCKIYRIGCTNCDRGPSWTVLSQAAVYQVTCSEHHAVCSKIVHFFETSLQKQQTNCECVQKYHVMINT
jgi:hypothetical protein